MMNLSESVFHIDQCTHMRPLFILRMVNVTYVNRSSWQKTFLNTQLVWIIFTEKMLKLLIKLVPDK